MDAELHNDLIERLGNSDLCVEAVALVEACWSGDAAIDEALGDGGQASAKPLRQKRPTPAAVFLLNPQPVNLTTTNAQYKCRCA